MLTAAAIQLARLLRPAPASLQHLTRFTRKYVDWRGKSVLCRTNFGAVLSCAPSDIIQRKIAYFGVWEPNLTAYLRRSLRSGDVFIDVGANIGYFSLLASRLVGTSGKVVAIEASPEIFERLRRNLKKNSAANVRPINQAAAYEPGQLSVFGGPPENSGRTSVMPLAGNRFQAFVEAQPLHCMLTPDELARIRLIKIDIEGAEAQVLKSFLENANLYGPRCELAVEVAPENSSMIGEMEAKGFFPYLLVNDYSDRDYLRPSIAAPRRHFGEVTEQSDFIFSKRDAEYL